jgi:hypothetical protein
MDKIGLHIISISGPWTESWIFTARTIINKQVKGREAFLYTVVLVAALLKVYFMWAFGGRIE